MPPLSVRRSGRLTCTACCCAGVPSGLRFMPGLLDAVRAAVAREAGQLFDKIRYVTEKVRAVRACALQVPAARQQKRQQHSTSDSKLYAS